jgi:hypothetical protein
MCFSGVTRPLFLQPVRDAPVQAVQVHAFVEQRVERDAAALLDMRSELDHLVHGLLAGEAPDEVLDYRAQFLLGFAGAEVRQDLHHHGNHHVHPAGAD